MKVSLSILFAGWCFCMAAGAAECEDEVEPAALLQVSGHGSDQGSHLQPHPPHPPHPHPPHPHPPHPDPPHPPHPPHPPSTSSYILQAYCGDSWLTLCSDIPSGWQQHNGKFQANISEEPPAASSDSDASNNYLTFGGYKVNDGTLPSTSTLTGWFSTLNANNVEMDMEGDAINYTNWTVAAEWAVQIKEASPSSKIQMTGMVAYYPNASQIAEDYPDTVDYFAVLIHAYYMDKNGYAIDCSNPYSGETWGYVQNWLNTSIPKSKLILALTTIDLKPCYMDVIKTWIKFYSLAGMSFWDWQNRSSDVSLECIEDPDVNCTSSTSSTTVTTTTASCDDQCVQGPYKGQCCDPDSVTTKGSCATLGQEGCCGNTDSSESYCQVQRCHAKCSSDSDVPGACCDTSQSTSKGNCGEIGQEACCGDTDGTKNWCQATS